MKSSLFSDISLLRFMFSREDKFRFLFLFALMFAGAILEAVGIGIIPGFVKFLMDPSSLAKVAWLGKWTLSLPKAPTVPLMLWASFILIVFMLAKSCFIVFVNYKQADVVIGQSIRLRDQMYCIYQKAPYEWHLQRSSSELLRNIQQDTGAILSGILLPCLDLTMSIIMSLLVIIVMIFGTPASTFWGMLITGVCIFFLVRIFQNKITQGGILMRDEGKGMIQAIQQGFGALIDARICNCESYFNQVYKNSAIRHGKAMRYQQTVQKSIPPLLEAVSFIGFIIILLFLLSGGDSVQSILPALSLLAVAIVKLKQLATKITSATNTMLAARASIPAVSRDLREIQDLSKASEAKKGVSKDIIQFKTLELEEVLYAYPNTKKPAVNSVSLCLNQGESIAFVGSTGCGKSTLVNLILGLLEPQSGAIKVNGVDIFINLVGWRKNIGYIPQTVFLLDDTIRANVAFGVPDDLVDEKQLNRALQSARLDKFVEGLPEGLDTIVGERGVRISGGQRQRIGIARSLYSDPRILVMDEATSALDNKTEAEVMAAIENLKNGRTLIMIAHRLTTVENCDRLYFLDGGCLVASGSYNKLIRSVPSFAEMASAID